ncbi:hypothetical protein GGS20DRAFT_572127 [Poronia punctata]|nr:hypothetical protein GGS20DRAFT_572127 [Poronia punctata]
MSASTSTSVSVSVTPTSTSTSTNICNAWVLPVTEPGCGVPYSSENIEVLAECCGSAPVISYANDCGVFCIAQDQSIKELQECFATNGKDEDDGGKEEEGGIKRNEIYCNAGINATATDTDVQVPATASASVVANKPDEEGDGDDDDDDKGDDGDKDDDAPGNSAGRYEVSKMGVLVGVLMGSVVALGAFQI